MSAMCIGLSRNGSSGYKNSCWAHILLCYMVIFRVKDFTPAPFYNSKGGKSFTKFQKVHKPKAIKVGRSKNPNLPKTKLSGLKICPKGPDRTESMVPGSRSTRQALGTYLPPVASL